MYFGVATGFAGKSSAQGHLPPALAFLLPCAVANAELYLLQALVTGSGRDNTPARRLDIQSDGASASATLSTLGRTSQRGELPYAAANTLRARRSVTHEEALVSVLDDMRMANPPVPFAHNYLLLNDRAHGGQGIVQVRACAHMSRRAVQALTQDMSSCAVCE